jgi:hypothetical protein
MKNDIQKRASNYIFRIFSTAGSGGSTSALLAAAHLVRGFNLTVAEAKPILADWNETNATPRWTEQELDRKLTEARTKGKMEAGCHIKDDDVRQQRDSAPYRPLHDVPTAKPADDEATRRKAAERAAVKASLRLPTEPEMQIIADLRKVSVKAVFYLVQDGLLKVGQWQNRPVFAIQSGGFAQIRRMDGRDFWPGAKVYNTAEPTPAFMGYLNKCPTGTRTMIAEGLVELLALIELEIRADDYRREHFPDREYQPVAFAVASSAHSKIDDIVMKSLRCKAIRIIADNDAKGFEAVERWTGTLQAAGIPTDNKIMPIGKDLGDALPQMPDSACYQLLQF